VRKFGLRKIAAPYLDATGLQRQNSIVDLMRYVALNQGADDRASYAGFIPVGLPTFDKLPDPENGGGRYSEEQLYALALYVYSLKPPPNPNKFDDVARRGEKIFDREGCATCHTPPLYTNNKLARSTRRAGYRSSSGMEAGCSGTGNAAVGSHK
jgi:hypothetical protein